MAYLTHEEYISMGGAIADPLLFERFEVRASKKVDNNTYNRLISMVERGFELPPILKHLMFELVGLYDTNAKATSEFKSANTDGVSVTYNTLSETELSHKANALIVDYLTGVVDDMGVPLLYRGVYATVCE